MRFKAHTIMKREPEIKECMTGGKPKKNAIIFSSPVDCVINKKFRLSRTMN